MQAGEDSALCRNQECRPGLCLHCGISCHALQLWRRFLVSENAEAARPKQRSHRLPRRVLDRNCLDLTLDFQVQTDRGGEFFETLQH